MDINRLATARIQELAIQFPAVLILGARQVGKTTLARQSFPEFPYVDLESPALAAQFQDDPAFQLESRTTNGIILDEAQQVPILFNALRGQIDAHRKKNGRYILLGSAQPDLIRGVSESLAGRVGILELAPLTPVEVAQASPQPGNDCWMYGGYPDAVLGASPARFHDWQEAYLNTYVQRDLPSLGIEAEPIFTRRLLTMLAHQQGQLLNANALANSLNVSHGRITRALDILEQTFLIRRLPPWFRNVGKRLTKSPKVYLRDTGMLHHLLNISSLKQLRNHPALGASWETFVVEDLIRRLSLQRPHSGFYFWRTSAGAEVDLLIERGGGIEHAIEIKAGMGSSHHARRLADCMADINAESGWIIDQGGESEALRPQVRRLAYAANPGWLLGEAPA